MTESQQAHPIEMLTAALGGRRIYTLLWALWLFVAMIVHYSQDVAKSDVVHGRTKAALATCVVGLVVYMAILLRALSSKERRMELLARQPNLLATGVTLRILVWVVSLLALGAALAPTFIR